MLGGQGGLKHPGMAPAKGGPHPSNKSKTSQNSWFSQKGLCYSFEILHGLLGNKNIKIPMREKKLGTPPSPLKKLILGG